MERAKREHNADQVILVAHSLGGLVSRDYLRRLASRESGLTGAPTKVAELIAVGTPWLGALKIARALVWGYNFDVGDDEHDDEALAARRRAGDIGAPRGPPHRRRLDRSERAAVRAAT